jgi:phosphatidylserine decarboxylase
MRIRIAREGYQFIAGTAGAAALFGLLGWVGPALVTLGAAGCVAAFFRDPDRQVPAGAGVVVSPADGRVIDVEEGVQIPQLPGPASRVSIFMSPLNVHVNRTPVAGTVDSVRHQAGKFHAAFSPKASPDNERNAILLTDEREQPFLMVQIAGFLARRIVCYLAPQARVERGARCGIIMFGSRVDLYLPQAVALQVRAGDRLRAGESVVGAYQ